jgi:hypothetical protein
MQGENRTKGGEEMTEQCAFITNFLGCDYELFKDAADDEAVIKRYNELTEEGRRDGFFPLIIAGSDDELAETLEMALEDAEFEDTPKGIAAFRESVLREAEDVDVQAFLAERLAEYMETYGEEIRGNFMEFEPNDCFIAIGSGDGSHSELIIAKIPAKNPWELAAWVPMGGYNSCPCPAEQVAVFKYWYEKYGAVPGVVNHDQWELALTKPPLTDADAEQLAEEQFTFCEDRVVQAGEDCDSIRALASALKGSTAWYFWWD